MDRIDAEKRMHELVTELNSYQAAYDKGAPQISDKEYDELYFELANLEQIYPELILPDSPTQTISFTTVSELRKVKHSHPMLSLDKTKDISQVESFLGNHEWIAMLKLDGLTCSIAYDENGNLVSAETRGNGIEGEDVTHNIFHVQNVPRRIPKEYAPLVVDGEIICKNDDFKFFSHEYANSRNFAAGSIRLLSAEESAQRRLSFVVWDVIKLHSNEEFETLSNKLALMGSIGFNVVRYSLSEWHDNDNNKKIQNAIKFLKTDAEIGNYPIDGIVFKYNNIAEYETMGRTDHHFRGGLAYKFYDEIYETELQAIEFSMGRTGVLTPVAVFKEVEIDGANVSRANLHNLSVARSILGEWWIKGQKIWVYKSNMIIPQISHAEPADEILGMDPAYFLGDPEVSFLDIPKTCPVCGEPTEIVKSETGVRELYCSNSDCAGKLVNKLDHWCGKKGLDIKGLSKATLEKLIAWGWINSITDLYSLREKESEWIEKTGFGPASVKKILDAIDASKITSLENFIAGIGIPLIGRRMAKVLSKAFGSYDAFRAAKSFMDLEGFGSTMDYEIKHFNYLEMDALVNDGVITITKEENNDDIAAPSHLALEGKTFVITGKLQSGTRDAVAEMIAHHGGKVVSSISSKTNYLVNNDINSTSSKNIKAKQLNIPIISEAELLEMIQQ